MRQAFLILLTALLFAHCAVDLSTEEYRKVNEAVRVQLVQVIKEAGPEHRKEVALIEALDQHISKLCKRVNIYDSALKIEAEGNILFRSYVKALELDSVDLIDLEKVKDKSLLLVKLKSNELQILEAMQKQSILNKSN